MKTLFVLLFLCLPAFGVTKYYISTSTGDDNRSAAAAQNPATPWKHFRGMAGAANAALAYTPVAGDFFVLKGCDVWGSADLPVKFNWSGSSGNPITIGVDVTYFNATNCPSGWNRPIWDAQGVRFDFIHFADPGTTSWGVIDNIEMKGLFCANQADCAGGQWFTRCYEACTNWTISNNYFHAFRIAFDNECATYSGAPGSAGNIYTNNVVDGSDAVPAGSCEGIYPSWASQMTYNVVHDLPNGFTGACGSGNTCTVAGNYIYNVNTSNGSNHNNFMEVTGGGTHYIHDNVETCPNNACGGESLMVGSSGEDSYIWNNVFYAFHASVPEFPQTGGQTIVGLHFWQNTIVTGAGAGGTCFQYSGQTGGTLTTLVIINNHCVSEGANSIDPNILTHIAVSSHTYSNNTLMTHATANTFYPNAQTYAASPISTCTGGTCATLAAGTVLCGVTVTCSGNFASVANDTAYAASLQTVNGVLRAVSPTRTHIARGSSPDTGAYQFTTLSGPGFSANPNPVAFGSVNVGSSGGPTTVTVTNTGTTNLVITSVTSNNARFAVSSNTCATVAASGTCNFAVTFSPLAAGAQSATVSVADNAGNPDLVTATGTGVAVGPAVQLSPTLLSFGNQIVNTTSPGQTTTLTNSGNATLNIASIATSNPQYVISGNTCSATLAAAANCNVTVKFTPTSQGAKNFSLLFTTNAPSSQDSVPLTGTGTVLQFVNQQAAVTTSGSNVFTFTYTPATIGNALLITPYCHASSGTVGTISLTSPGWTSITQSIAPTSNTIGKAALFSAIAPNGATATFTVTFGSVTDCSVFGAYLLREVTGNNTTGGATTFNAVGSSGAASGGCNQAAANVTPPLPNEGIAFFCIDGSNAVNAPYNLGAFDNVGDAEGDQLLTAGAGTPVSPNFVTGGTYIVLGVAVAPASPQVNQPAPSSKMLLSLSIP